MDLIRTDGYPVVAMDIDPTKTASDRKGRHKLSYYQSVGGAHAVHYELFLDVAPDETLVEAFCEVGDDLDLVVARSSKRQIAKIESVRSDIEDEFDALKGASGAYADPQYSLEWRLYYEQRSKQIQLIYTTVLSAILPKDVVA